MRILVLLDSQDTAPYDLSGVAMIVHGLPQWVLDLGIAESGVYDVETNPVTDPTAAQKAARAQAYRDESDPLFFKWQRGEATQQDWIDKINEIKARFPY